MEWEGKEEGGDVEDRRGIKPGVAIGGGIGGLVIMALVYFLGIDPQQAQQVVNQIGGPQQQGEAKPINDGYKKFSDTILAMNNKVWAEQFQRFGKSYEKPHMVLFSEAVNTRCGRAPSSVGPFYCPGDNTVYLDPSFFEELDKRLGGSKAEFSQAYVISHEVGHHVQNLLGYNSRVDEFRAQDGENAGIRLELQADYLAGVWAHHADEKYKIIEKGDVEEAIKTAKHIGDDAIQKKLQGWTSPEKYNHGTAAQRYKYFMEGLNTGDFSKATLDKFFSRQVKPLDL
jgi:predicted metalloprotease